MATRWGAPAPRERVQSVMSALAFLQNATDPELETVSTELASIDSAIWDLAQTVEQTRTETED
jgi:hypothetical protein